ncbi:MAG: methylcobamide--CoM methyltransferase [Eubacterium sp.]|jgi:uroporphyrinogen-III decarboxylase|nr:methylcobamide--CoM methyltransferase [Eubacterium sp.]MCH4045927.1 methylcobamide--CoM methyltransferase [Eubacterium sp.]MCH4079021.1 methylcobamide--CoM methyltransferase [Eubacterium sp.]MCI1307675.1 methylcobamide--CoM methyltransferase [Eubacterium sp.]MCI1428356.1 methylcobamide--CoM methyltransferase [Eubacterium sp.]
MQKIRNYKCNYSNSVGISPEVTDGLDLDFPDAYKHRETMALLSKAIKEHDHAGFCLLPFCRTVEIEAMGAAINYGDSVTGPRAADPICDSVEDIMKLPDMDFSRGRVHEVLEACRILADEGEHVCLEITGPWTQLTSMMDAAKVFRAARKQKEELIQAMNRLGDQLLRYVDEAKNYGVEIITFSDSAGAVDILGPRMAAQSAEDILYPFMKRLEEHVDDSIIVQVCPKLAFALLDTGFAETRVHDFGGSVDFLEAMLNMRGKVKFAGQVCIKNIGVTLANGKFQELILK